jgi:DNA repair exonuclease SbcCD ATPase subunit
MKIKNIEWRNIGSYGNKLQKLEIPDDGGLWMVLGKNGHGKSTLINIPQIAYYGKRNGFKKEEIANRMNKHGYLKMEVEISPGNLATIERNISPTDLKVFKYRKGDSPNEDNDIGKAGIKNYQDYIDIEITGLPYNIFSNIISLSVNDFKSFLTMSPNDKRIIIDKLFSMEIINRMNDMIRKDLREVKINIDLYDREIVSLDNSIKGATKELEKLKTKVAQDNANRIEEIGKKMAEFKNKLVDAQAKYKEYKEKDEEIKKAREIYISQKKDLENDIKGIQKELTLYNQDKCPTCATPFSEQRFSLLKEDLTSKYKNKKDSYEHLIKSGKKYDEVSVKIKEGIDKITEFVMQLKSGYQTLQNELNKLEKVKPEEFKSIENIIAKNSKSIRDKEEKKVKFDEKHKNLSILENLYSDAGVKKKILESYLPTLNKEVEYTLNELHFPYSLRFNSNFEPNLEHLGIQISVDTLSDGEKKRVDLAVLISIMRMLKRKYHHLNIFMLDEVLSSIDGDGIYDIIGLLQKTAKEMKMNIFIINHSPLPVEYFSYKLEIQKNNGFSDLTIEKLDESGNGEN